MILKVNKDICEIKQNEVWNVGDYNVHTVQVELSEEFDGLVNKVRYFVEDNSYDMLITDNVAQVPYEATVMEGTIKIGVYGYDADTDILVQSTSPVNKYISSGTYTGEADNTEPLTPTDKEQMESAIQKNTNDITDLEANKQDKLTSGVNIKTINNESILSGGNLTLVTEETDPIFTNSPAYSITDNDITYWNNKANMSDIPDVSNFITKDVDDLTYYTKSTDMQTAINNAVGSERTARENADNSLQNQIDAITVSSDVVDVVSTYQDLVDYDTQHIKENDIIKVMQDSTHDNAISYYRWVIVNHVGSWEYVGSEGPYYTKSETDTLLNAKQNTITTTNKLQSDLVDDTNQTNQFVTLEEKQTWNNKPDEIEINNLKNNIENVSTLSNLFERITGTGTSVTLNDTSDTIMKLNLDTTTSSQVTTTGKNLLPSTLTSQTINGVTVTRNSDGSITLNGTTSVSSDFKWFEGEMQLEAGTYYIGLISTSSDFNLYSIGSNGTNIIQNPVNNPYTTLTLASNTTFTRLSSYAYSGKTFNNETFYPIICKELPVEYEIYTGGQPAPSPSYPQTIHTITGNNDIKIRNKQMYNYTDLRSSYNFLTYDNDGWYTAVCDRTNLDTGDYFNFSTIASDNLETDTTYSIVTEIKSFTITGNGGSLNVVDRWGQFTTGTSGLSTVGEHVQTSTTKSSFDNLTGMLMSNIYVRANSKVTAVFRISVIEGTDVTVDNFKYEPYKQQTYPINLGDIELCKIGDYEDILFKNTINSEYYNNSLELNKWYLKKNVGKVVLDGSESIARDSTSVSGAYRFLISSVSNIYKNSGNDDVSNIYCNKLIAGSISSTFIAVQGISYGKTTSDYYREFVVYIDATKAMTRDEFKTWLSTHNLIVYYVLETPTYTLLNDTLQTQLDNLQYALAYDDKTYISQTNTDLPFIIDAETYVDLTDYVKNTDYASSSTGGVIKTANDFATAVNQDGKLYARVDTYSDYNSRPNTSFISKGTLENVITGKELIDSSYHDSTKQNVTDESLNTVNKNIVPAINEVDSIAKGANQALSYGNYSTMITAFNSLANNVYNVGQNVMIITLQVPDLWISGIESTSQTYTYTTDEAITTELNTNGYVQVGYYKLSALETQKVNLTDYEQNTNKTTTISSSSTNTEYPSAKAVYDYIQALDGDEVNY